jgi:Flp pilus assembly pilin Flp
MVHGWLRLSTRFIREDEGQDLIEYALLTAIVSVGSLLIFDSIRTKMGNAYLMWSTEIQDNWEPSAPIE